MFLRIYMVAFIIIVNEKVKLVASFCVNWIEILKQQI